MSASPREPHESIWECLEADHRRLDAIMVTISELVEGSAFDEAVRRFIEFRAGLDLHIEVEEEVLFPAFERETGMTQGPTQVMRIEHTRIREAMGDASRALGDSEAAAFDAARARLEGILGSHNMKEEQILYPMCDRALPPEEVSLVVGRMRSGR